MKRLQSVQQPNDAVPKRVTKPVNTVIGASSHNQNVKSVITSRCVDVFISRLHPHTSENELLDCVNETAALCNIQEAQLMLTTGSTRLAVSRGQQTWYHSTCYI